MQLFSIDKGVSQTLQGHAGCFHSMAVPGRSDAAQVLIFEEKKADQPAKLFVMEVGRDKDAPGGVFYAPFEGSRVAVRRPADAPAGAEVTIRFPRPEKRRNPNTVRVLVPPNVPIGGHFFFEHGGRRVRVTRPGDVAPGSALDVDLSTIVGVDSTGDGAIDAVEPVPGGVPLNGQSEKAYDLTGDRATRRATASRTASR